MAVTIGLGLNRVCKADAARWFSKLSVSPDSLIFSPKIPTKFQSETHLWTDLVEFENFIVIKSEKCQKKLEIVRFS